MFNSERFWYPVDDWGWLENPCEQARNRYNDDAYDDDDDRYDNDGDWWSF